MNESFDSKLREKMQYQCCIICDKEFKTLICDLSPLKIGSKCHLNVVDRPSVDSNVTYVLKILFSSSI